MTRDTEDLIHQLARQGVSSRAETPPGLSYTVMLGVLPAIAIFLIFFGFRPDFMQSLANPYFVLRGMFLAALAAVCLTLIPPVGRPGAVIPWHRLLWAPSILVLGLVAERFGWDPAMNTVSAPAWVCITGIASLAAFPILALLLAVRRQAATQPELAGAISGLTGGAIGATLYALWCAETSPGYVALWYGLALAICAAAGALAGRHLLRW
ncbi:MAG: hypothetical protein FD175_2061 [Beijerinckiaceae bacterium]|nr:MAG: hypothetical protein FD175_2061 [Beijerinckiaceae bacterium]